MATLRNSVKLCCLIRAQIDCEISLISITTGNDDNDYVPDNYEQHQNTLCRRCPLRHGWFIDRFYLCRRSCLGKVVEVIGQDPEFVFAATHGERAIDNFRQLWPTLARANTEEVNNPVQGFEESILFYADATISMAQGLERTRTYITRTRDTWVDTRHLCSFVKGDIYLPSEQNWIV
ncbi:hypothetical protein PM082_016778 [Marasmius tenuissimus]|nr:hypothetical protein PM082_016778 [Marasmius tenuissimus]